MAELSEHDSAFGEQLAVDAARLGRPLRSRNRHSRVRKCDSKQRMLTKHYPARGGWTAMELAPDAAARIEVKASRFMRS
jgi:hypothetical protein